jgi:predicted ArsR family transcriptional regulator
MDGWWVEIENDIITCLRDRGRATPSDVGEYLGLSETAAMSVLAMLVSDGKVRISLVELPADGAEGRSATVRIQ